MRIGQLIWWKLIDYDMSISELARKVGCARSSIQRIVNDDAVYIGLDIRRGLCRVLDIKADVLDAAIHESLKVR